MARNYIENQIGDIVEAIKNNYSESELDTEISMLEELLTVDSDFLDVDGTSVTLIENYDNDGTGYWDYDVTYGDSTAITAWRLINYANTYNQARRELGYTLFSDEYNVYTTRAEMEEYNKLIDGDSTSTIEISYSDSTSWISVEYPTDRQTNLVKTNVEETGVRVYFAYSMNNINWVYYAATTGDHGPTTGILTEYSTSGLAEAAYVELDAGLNTLQLPSTVQMRYGKVFLISPSGELTVNMSQYSWSETIYFDDISAGTLNTGFVTITSPDGKTVFDGNTITIKDASNNTRVILGELP